MEKTKKSVSDLAGYKLYSIHNNGEFRFMPSGNRTVLAKITDERVYVLYWPTLSGGTMTLLEWIGLFPSLEEGDLLAIAEKIKNKIEGRSRISATIKNIFLMAAKARL